MRLQKAQNLLEETMGGRGAEKSFRLGILLCCAALSASPAGPCQAHPGIARQPLLLPPRLHGISGRCSLRQTGCILHEAVENDGCAPGGCMWEGLGLGVQGVGDRK